MCNDIENHGLDGYTSNQAALQSLRRERMREVAQVEK